MEARLAGATRDLIDRSREAFTLFPGLARKPSAILLWLVGARASQIALLTMAVGLSLGLPPFLNAALPRLYPDVTVEKKVLGFIPKRVTRVDPRREIRRAQWTASAWAGAGLCVGIMLWLQVPMAAARATDVARKREREADSLLASAPRESLVLYRSSMSLAIDPAHEASLRDKVVDLEHKLAADSEGGARADGHGPSSLSGNRGVATVLRPLQDPPAGLGSLGPEGRYRLDLELGRGGMGVVYRATDRVLDREVALKELPVQLTTDPDRLQRFRQEARTLARLSHPNIIQIYDLFEDQDRLWIAMEYVDGGDLATMIESRGRLAGHEAARLAWQIAEAMQMAHERDIVHRDIKPMNVLLTANGTPKLADFGLARLVSSGSHTVAGTILGSPDYMSPEQAAGRVADSRSDIYALGITLYEMLTGTPPFEGDTPAILAQHITQLPSPPRQHVADLPLGLELIVLAMLEKDPRQRPADMATVARLLAPFANGAAPMPQQREAGAREGSGVPGPSRPQGS